MKFSTIHLRLKSANLLPIETILWHRFLFPCLIPIMALLAWFFLTQGQNSESIFPTPQSVWHVTVRLTKNGVLWNNLWVSSLRAIAGFIIGGGIGFFLGVLNGQFKIAEEILNTPIQMIRNVPHLALLPLILIWFGLGETSKIILIALGCFFPIYLNSFYGIRHIDKKLLEMGKVYGLTHRETFQNIIFPGATPSIMVGIRQSLGRMWITLIVAETVAAKSGIGYMATNAREFMQIDIIVLTLIIYAVLGSFSDFAAAKIEKHLLRWHQNYRKILEES